jgi:hypothetical protein
MSGGRWSRRVDLFLFLMLANAGFAITDAVAGSWRPAALNGGLALLLAWDLWRRRRNRKRAPRAYGAKSRARLAALARKAREATRPRPVLRPAPGGVP